jgi:hypothetical protein
MRAPVRGGFAAPVAWRVGASDGLVGTNATHAGDGASCRTRTTMSGPIAEFRRKIRYRRRWRAVAAARSAADEAMADLDRRVRDRGRRPMPGERPAAERQAAERVPPRPGG